MYAWSITELLWFQGPKVYRCIPKKTSICVMMMLYMGSLRHKTPNYKLSLTGMYITVSQNVFMLDIQRSGMVAVTLGQSIG